MSKAYIVLPPKRYIKIPFATTEAARIYAAANILSPWGIQLHNNTPWINLPWGDLNSLTRYANKVWKRD